MVDTEIRSPETDEAMHVVRRSLETWSPPPGHSPPAPPAPHRAKEPRHRRHRRRTVVLAAATVSIAAISGGGAGWLVARTTTPDTSEPVAVTITGESAGVAELVESVDDSILAIVVTVRYRQGPFIAEGEGAGTGIVLTSDGLVLTNAHVVEDATAITVTLSGQAESLDAELVGVASDVDVAVIRVSGVADLVPATFADSDSVRVGQDVIAIGNALDLGDTMSVSRGIISALDRTIETDDASYTGLIQTDAAISSGNSGGALIDMNGAVIGMNSAAAASSAGVTAENIGFAIPTNQVLDALADLGISFD